MTKVTIGNFGGSPEGRGFTPFRAPNPATPGASAELAQRLNLLRKPAVQKTRRLAVMPPVEINIPQLLGVKSGGGYGGRLLAPEPAPLYAPKPNTSRFRHASLVGI